MSYFDTNARKRDILEHLKVGVQILSSWVWENLSSLCNPSQWWEISPLQSQPNFQWLSYLPRIPVLLLVNTRLLTENWMFAPDGLRNVCIVSHYQVLFCLFIPLWLWVWNKHGTVILPDRVVWNENYFLSGRPFHFNVSKVFNMNLALEKGGKENVY